MFYVKYLILLQIINAKLQLNLYFTDDALKNNDENTSIVQQQHCLYAGTNQPHELLDRLNSHFSLVAYCLSEPLSEFNIDNIDFFTNFTFVELRKMNITSEDLYLWSASIDLIENYQYYLNKNDSVLSTNIFYNCTWPRFGPQCQYELDNHNHDFPSLKEYINTYHHYNDWSHTNWTCYIHLECIRSPGMRCLDWTDICDGKVDCLNNGIDEEHCWQLEMNVCQNDEYRCYDGLCVPKYFLRTANVVIQNEYKQTHFQCPNSNKFIPHWKLENGNCDCDTNDKVYCEIYDRNILWFFGPTQAGEFCNGVIDFKPILINGKKLTDETDCEHRVTKKNVRTHLQSSSSSDSKYSLMKTLKHCHFGISLHVWLDSKKQLSKLTCLCPSNYYD